MTDVSTDLPVLGSEPHERSDAARNRRKVLEAASRLFECHGAANVSMEAVAAEAGVGKGTLFRRFGDRASLARSVLEQREIDLQEGMIRGPAPLGPGAPAYERLCAFGRAYLDFLERHGDLILAAEFGVPGLRLAHPVYAFYRTHVTLLLNEAGVRRQRRLPRRRPARSALGVDASATTATCASCRSTSSATRSATSAGGS